MLNKECSKCGKNIKVPQCSADESNATGVLCECLEKPVCFECNVENKDEHNYNCAFGFPEKGDWFYPKD